MSNYSKTTDFAAKDSLASGNPSKVIKGTEIDTEFNNLATSSATKANKVASPSANNLLMMDSSGDLADSTILTDGIGGITATALTASTITVTTLDFSTGGAAPLVKVKTADETVSASTTLQDDDHLTSFSLATGKRYRIRAGLFGADSSTGDLKIFFSFSNTPQASYGDAFGWNNGTGGGITFDHTTAADAISVGSTASFVDVNMVVLANATTGGTVKLQWAQHTAAGTTTIKAGSWMEVQQLN